MPIFDTNILIDYLRGEKRASEILHEYRDRVAITVITGYELIKGYRTKKEETALDMLLSRVRTYHTDDRSMRVAGELYRELKDKGKLINEADVLIAGIVLANDEILITDDKDFSALSDAMEDSLLLLK
jgi:predicted nucleic acid-binding protein